MIEYTEKIKEIIKNIEQTYSISLLYFFLIPIVGFGFYDFPYVVRLFGFNKTIINYFFYISAILYFLYILFSNKKTGNFILACSIYIISISISTAYSGDYSNSLNLFTIGLTMLIKYFNEFYSLRYSFDVERDKISLKFNKLFVMVIFYVIWYEFCDLSFRFNHFIINVWYPVYYEYLLKTNDYKAPLFNYLMQNKFKISTFILLSFVIFPSYIKRHNVKL